MLFFFLKFGVCSIHENSTAEIGTVIIKSVNGIVMGPQCGNLENSTAEIGTVIIKSVNGIVMGPQCGNLTVTHV